MHNNTTSTVSPDNTISILNHSWIFFHQTDALAIKIPLQFHSPGFSSTEVLGSCGQCQNREFDDELFGVLVEFDVDGFGKQNGAHHSSFSCQEPGSYNYCQHHGIAIVI